MYYKEKLHTYLSIKTKGNISIYDKRLRVTHTTESKLPYVICLTDHRPAECLCLFSLLINESLTDAVDSKSWIQLSPKRRIYFRDHLLGSTSPSSPAIGEATPQGLDICFNTKQALPVLLCFHYLFFPVSITKSSHSCLK